MQCVTEWISRSSRGMTECPHFYYHRMTFITLSLGVGSILAQFILFRELQTAFQGNELSLSVILFCWLLGAGLGGLLAKGLKPRRVSLKTLACLFLGSGLFCFFSLFLSRGLKYYLRLSPFEILQPLQILLISAAVIMPLTLIMGMSFIHICRITNNPVKTYSWEAGGAFLAGLLSIVLIKYLNSAQIMAIVSLLFLICGLFIMSLRANEVSEAISDRRLLRRPMGHLTPRNDRFWFLIFLVLSAVLCIPSLKLLERFEHQSQALGFKPQELVKSASSVYANIAVTRNYSQFSLYENGRLSFSSEDTEAVEEFSHFILLSHPNPEDILLIGSGISGVIAEIVKHPIKSLSYIEPDKKLIDMAREFIPQSAFYGLKDSRLKIYHQDARSFLNKTLNKYDIIILNLGDPSSLQLNRFYTVEFFRKIRPLLKPSGIFCLAFSSKEDILAAQMLKYNSSLYQSAKTVFNGIELIPGERLILLCSPDKAFRINPDELISRFSQRGIHTSYLVPEYLRIKLLRQDYIRERLEASYSHCESRRGEAISGGRDCFVADAPRNDKIQENRDYLPYGFFYYLGLWGKQSWLNFALLWSLLGRIKFIYWCIFFLVLTLVFRKRALEISVFTSGSLGVALVSLISFIFQIRFGFLYYRLGVIVASFMLGLSLGSLLAIKVIKKADALKMIYSLEIMLGLTALAPVFVLGESPEIYFLFSLLGGLIIGMEFGGFYSLFSPHKVYLLDLAGASAGSLLTGLAFIPALGVYKTCFLLALIKFLPLVFLKRQSR